MSTQNLLVEIFVEELPPKALKKLGETFANGMRQGLIDLLLVLPEEKWEWYASPRRLGVKINNVDSHQRPKLVTEKLMPVSVAYDSEGKPTQALLKKAKAKKFREEDFSTFTRRMEGNTEVLIHQWTDDGLALEQVLGDVLEATLSTLPIPKMMTYQLANGWDSVEFVRPAHRLIVLHGAEVLTGVRTHSNKLILGLEPGRTTQGHRYEAATPTLDIRDANSYETQMESDGAVIPGFEKRRTEIVRQFQATAASLGLEPIDDEALLDEVTALVERPNVLVGQFEEAYLDVPPECLILTMKANQKYFPLLDRSGKLTNQFLMVSNISPDDASAVIQGNERVVRPRLADAKFFFDQDRKKTLESRVPGLAKVVYHNKLGSQGERTDRVRSIAKRIADEWNQPALPGKVGRAAILAKADLLTDMVGEFPELQGIMGRYYALHDGFDEDIAFAIEDHYKPRFAGDELPRNATGVCLALADKLETLAGLFSVGERPTGDKDPFALRRHAIGVLRILMEKALPLNFQDLLGNALTPFASAGTNAFNSLLLFMIERLAGLLREQGYTANEVDAVLALNPALLVDIPKRLHAVRAFAVLPESASLAAANKRVGNILKKAEGGVGSAADPARFIEAEEKALFTALSDIAPRADAAFESGDYTASLQALAALKAPVDAFFDQVMVNADDPALRANRLALLNQLHQTMNRVADISRLAA